MAFKSLVSLAAVAMLVMAGPSNAEPNKGQGQGQAKGQGQEHRHQDDRHYDDKHGNDRQKKMTHGQVVSECNHRANERKLKGKERKHFVEWCTERGERYRFDDRRYKYDEDCYDRADRKNLSGLKRVTFIAECTARRDREYDRDRQRRTDRDRDYDPRGRDVLRGTDQQR